MNVARKLATTNIEGQCGILQDYEDSVTIKLFINALVQVFAAGMMSLDRF